MVLNIKNVYKNQRLTSFYLCSWELLFKQIWAGHVAFSVSSSHNGLPAKAAGPLVSWDKLVSGGVSRSLAKRRFPLLVSILAIFFLSIIVLVRLVRQVSFSLGAFLTLKLHESFPANILMKANPADKAMLNGGSTRIIPMSTVPVDIFAVFILRRGSSMHLGRKRCFRKNCSRISSNWCPTTFWKDFLLCR